MHFSREGFHVFEFVRIFSEKNERERDMTDSEESFPPPPPLVRSEAIFYKDKVTCKKCGCRVCEACAYTKASDCLFTNAQSLPETIRRGSMLLNTRQTDHREPKTRVLGTPLHDGWQSKDTRVTYGIHIPERDCRALRTVLDYSHKNYQLRDTDQLFVAASMRMIQQVIRRGWRTRLLICPHVLDGSILRWSKVPDYRERPIPVLQYLGVDDIDHRAVTRAFFKRGLVFSLLYSVDLGFFYVIELHETFEFDAKDNRPGLGMHDPFGPTMNPEKNSLVIRS